MVGETGAVYGWDVVSEVVEWRDGGYTVQGNMWGDYIDLAFIYAREADPDALLFYSDFVVSQRKSEKIRDMVQNMLERDIPIDGVALQFVGESQSRK